tara:strand:+ start:1196 stop:1390 length:195 start_codon:yes stop_codon:yes gene_type:complete
MKQYLEYDPISGAITDDKGTMVISMMGYTPITLEASNTSIDDMIKLKNSVFTAEEVIQIKKANL